MIMFDQDAANALATGDSVTYNIGFRTVAPRFAPLRVTLVWTDPPGNPVSSMKLVNDLDLIVTNLQTGNVYVGNDIPTDSDFNQYWPAGYSNSLPFDVVNNVENVFIAAPLAPQYSITVRARRVNVNAVTSQTNGVRQDYAVVVSSGNTRLTNVFQSPVITSIAKATDISPNVKTLTNGIAWFNERVGANSPLLEPITNNHHFPSAEPGIGAPARSRH
jgi:hypothetical protein